MKKLGLLMVLLVSAIIISNQNEPLIKANDKFKGKEKEWLEKCALRLNAQEAAECSEFKKYYQSLGTEILENSKNLSNEIEEVKKDIERLATKSDELTAQIRELQSQKVIIEGNISVTNSNIEAIQKDIDALRIRIEKRQQEIKKRMQDNQLFVNGNRKIAFIIESSDFSDMLRRLSVLQQISQADEERINLLRLDQNKLSEEERELSRQKEDLVAQRDDIALKEQQVANLQAANMELINEYMKNKADIEERQREAEATYETIVANASQINTTVSNQQIDNIVNNNTSTSGWGPVLSGSWYRSAGTWYYGADLGGGRHLGMDFAGYQGMGQPVLAPANSIVLITKSGCADYGGLGNRCGSPISGAGNWVILATEIDGITYTIRYYHLQSAGITTKSTVQRGEVIGYMGSSGTSTGPHLHLEIMSHGPKGLQSVYDDFKQNHDLTFGAGWGISSTCDNRGTPCRMRPETFYGS